MNKWGLEVGIHDKYRLLRFTSFLIPNKKRYNIETHFFNLYLFNKIYYDKIMYSNNILDINKIFKYL